MDVYGASLSSNAHDPSRGFRPSSDLVARMKGELMHHLRELWLKGRKYIPQDLSDRQIADRLDVPLHQLQQE